MRNPGECTAGGREPDVPMWFNPDRAVLAAWDRFPAQARPRPIPISAPPLIGEDGFSSDVDAKLAALDGRYELVAALPSDPPPTLPVTLLDGPAELPTRTAQQAFDALLATATFGSDRGPLTLPAWLFTAPGAKEPLAWPAVADSAFWPRGPNALVLGGGARLPAPGPVCPGEQLLRYEPPVLESATAVVVGLRAVPYGVQPGTPMPDCAIAAPGSTADHPVRLASPLNGRVLVAPVGVGYSEVLAVLPR